MKKVEYALNSCAECPFITNIKTDISTAFCDKFDAKITNINTIPVWCMLPEYNSNEKIAIEIQDEHGGYVTTLFIDEATMELLLQSGLTNILEQYANQEG